METENSRQRSLKSDQPGQSHLPSPSSQPQEMTDSADTDFEDLSPLSESNPPALCGIGARKLPAPANQTGLDYSLGYHRVIKLAMDSPSLPPRPASEGSSRLQVSRPYDSNLVANGVTTELPALRDPHAHTAVTNHEDLIRTPKHTIVNMCPGRSDYTTAYVVKFDSLLAYRDFIVDAYCDQWLQAHSLQLPGPGHLERETNPLLANLFLLREVSEWLEQDESFSFHLVQVASWTQDRLLQRADQSETRQSISGIHRVRVQRTRSFKSFDEAAAAVFLDGYLHGISTVFGCIMIDTSKIDFDTFVTVKTRCIQQREHRDIAVEEARGKLFIH